MSEPIAVIAFYRFKPGTSEDAVRALLCEHRATLTGERLVSAREPWTLQSYTDPLEFCEIFEWLDRHAGTTAADNPKVMAIWKRFAAACTSVGLSMAKTVEAGQPFAHFRPFPTG